MAVDDAFFAEQRGVVRAMVLGAATTILALGVAIALAPAAQTGTAERLAYALRSDAIVMLWLGAAIANVARLRFFSPGDIAGSAAAIPGPALRRASAILQNTLEQAVLAVAAHVGVALALDGYRIVVPTLVALFCLGRFLFWAGYARGAAGRALGFALTFYPSLAGLVIGVAAGWI